MKSKKERLKALREERAGAISQARERMKADNKLMKAIKTQIKESAMTVPQIAQAIGEPPSKVLVYLSGLKKFGMAVEAGKEGDYYTYQGAPTP
ncbi:MAG: winged helix-turn-helix domain-containing protein [Desulfobacter sp.]|nr:MAG: winged helix-turn-helix domain-containing protein [Desulfobacter sp.]